MTTTTKDDLRRYRKELSKIEPRYLALKELVINLEKLLSLDAAKDNEVDLDRIMVEQDAFDGLTTKDAALKALFIINAPVKSAAVADFLEMHGFEHQSKNFANTVNTALDRLRGDALVDKATKGWQITAKGRAECEYRLFKDPFMDSLAFGPTAS